MTSSAWKTLVISYDTPRIPTGWPVRAQYHDVGGSLAALILQDKLWKAR